MAEKKENVSTVDPKQLAELKQRSKDFDRMVSEDVAWIMSEARGRRFISWVFEMAGMDKLSFTGNSETFFREGGRNVGLAIKTKIDEQAPEMYIKMLQETLERNRKNAT